MAIPLFYKLVFRFATFNSFKNLFISISHGISCIGASFNQSTAQFKSDLFIGITTTATAVTVTPTITSTAATARAFFFFTTTFLFCHLFSPILQNTRDMYFFYFNCARYFCASKQAMHPLPAAIMACLKFPETTSPAAKIPSKLVRHDPLG